MMTKIKYVSVLILALIVSWFIPITGQIWKLADKHTFLILNGMFIGHPQWQNIVAWLNSRYADWSFEGFVLLLYCAYALFKKDKNYLFKFLFLALVMLLTQVLIDKIFFFKILHIRRLSPSYVFGTQVDFSIFKYPNNKTISMNSFPADHATTLILFAIASFSHFNKATAIMATCITIALTLPRLITGAHWLSDVILGAFCISLFSWHIAEIIRIKYFSNLIKRNL